MEDLKNSADLKNEIKELKEELDANKHQMRTTEEEFEKIISITNFLFN